MVYGAQGDNGVNPNQRIQTERSPSSPLSRPDGRWLVAERGAEGPLLVAVSGLLFLAYSVVRILPIPPAPGMIVSGRVRGGGRMWQ